MLVQIGMGPKVRQWLMCARTATIYIMVNGSPTIPFAMEKGVRQGDLISSFLFSIFSESLSFILKTTKMQGLIEGVRVGNNHVSVPHLQFADDTLLFFS